MAQPIPEQPPVARFHVGDGGYYDNFGVGTAVGYLQYVLPYFEKTYSGQKVMVLQIRSSPAGQPSVPHGRWECLQQQLGPLTTLLSVRTSAQVFRNDSELQLLKQTWEQQGGQLLAPVFQFSDPNPPLSWHLTPSQKTDLAQNWQKQQGNTITSVKQFLGCR